MDSGVSEGIRTPDPRLRRALLYPAELQIHSVVLNGAGNEGRTRDIQLGRLTLYQLSYSRIDGRNSKIRTCGPLLPRQVRYRTALYSEAFLSRQEWLYHLYKNMSTLFFKIFQKFFLIISKNCRTFIKPSKFGIVFC